MSAPLRAQGLDIDMSTLVYAGQRSHVMEYLRETGWHVTGSSRTELFEALDLPAVPPREEGDPLGEIVYVSAKLS